MWKEKIILCSWFCNDFGTIHSHSLKLWLLWKHTKLIYIQRYFFFFLTRATKRIFCLFRFSFRTATESFSSRHIKRTEYARAFVSSTENTSPAHDIESVRCTNDIDLPIGHVNFSGMRAESSAFLQFPWRIPMHSRTSNKRTDSG